MDDSEVVKVEDKVVDAVDVIVVDAVDVILKVRVVDIDVDGEEVFDVVIVEESEVVMEVVGVDVSVEVSVELGDVVTVELNVEDADVVGLLTKHSLNSPELWAFNISFISLTTDSHVLVLAMMRLPKQESDNG